MKRLLIALLFVMIPMVALAEETKVTVRTLGPGGMVYEAVSCSAATMFGDMIVCRLPDGTRIYLAGSFVIEDRRYKD